MKNSLQILSFLGIVGMNAALAVEGAPMVTKNTRKAGYPIHEMFINRWSPRAMSGASISDQQLYTLFEAARWAPSSYNSQPWRFIYVKRDSSNWQKFFDLLVPFNQTWCKNAAALVVIISKKNFDWGEPSISHSFDAGAAWQNLSLQGSEMGLVIHGMSGFDYDKAKKELYIPDDYVVEVMFAVGHPADETVLPENLRKDEKPSGRKPLQELIYEGSFVK